MDVKHGFAFPGEGIRDEQRGDILLTPGNFAIGGGFKGDKFKYFDGAIPSDYILNEGDLIVTMTDLSKQADTLGYPALVPKSQGLRFLHNQRLGKVLIKSSAELDKGFLFYLLRTAEYRHEVLASATGTTVKHTSPGRILAHKAMLPPLAEQKRIAGILGALDDKIELNRRMNRTLEDMARALFQSWFVDFDPVRAKAAGLTPAGLDHATAALFPKHLEDSPIGPIPQGWSVKNLGEIADFDKGLSYKGEGLADEGGMPMVNLGCFTGRGLFNADRVKRYTGEYRERHLISAGDLVIANTDMTQNRVIIGSPALVPEMNGVKQFLFTHHVFAVRFKPDSEIWRRYVFFTLLKPEFREIAEGFSTGTTVLALPRDGLINYSLCLPPVPLLEAFEKQVRPLLSAVDANLHEARTLSTLRDTLLPKLLSGELHASLKFNEAVLS